MAELEVRFDDRAQQDVRVAVEWYEDQENNLGAQFVSTIDETVERIQQFPRMFPTVISDVRRALTKRFPYAVYFQVDDSRVIVLGLLHTRRSQDVLNVRTAAERRAESNGPDE